MNDSTPSPSPLSSFRSQRRIEFADTDMGGICHFSRFFIFMETTEHLFHEAVGSSIQVRIDGDEIGWPRVAASCDYLGPVRFGEIIDIQLTVARKGRSSMTYEFLITCGERHIARGRLSSVCCLMNHPEGLKKVPLPEPFADRVEQAGDGS